VKLPRDVTGDALVKALAKLGYVKVRQTGSHVRLTTARKGEHHVTVPMNDPIKVGTLRGVLGQVAAHARVTLDELIAELEL
jgi:predicted RNA binding protein YcfA (HicA-like mRNA interferase family)